MKQLLLLITISIAVLFFNNLPLIISWSNQLPELRFLGRVVINSQDFYTYTSFIEQARNGKILFENLYTSAPQQPLIFRPSYLLIGKFAALTDISSIAAFQISRITLNIIFMAVLYLFISIFFKKSGERILAYTVVLTSSGLSFLLGGFFGNSTDLWVPESITFLSLAEPPHFVWSQILMLLGFWLFIKASSNKLRDPSSFGLRTTTLLYILSGLSFLLLSFDHPFNILVVILTFLIICVWLRKLIRGLFITVPIISLGLLYQAFTFYQNPIMRSWYLKNLLISPEPISYLLGFGLILILAFIGVETALKDKKIHWILLLSWVASAAVLLYAPISFQRRFSEGIHIPLAILATLGILKFSQKVSEMFLKKWHQKSFWILSSFLVLVLSLSSLGHIWENIVIVNSETTDNYYYHLPQSEIDAMSWLKYQTNPNDIILSNWFYGNIIPGLIGRKVYFGHKIQTPDFDQKIDRTNKFLVNSDPKSAYRFLKDNHIKFIYLGKNDTMLQGGFKPDEKPYLLKVYNLGNTLIYQVKEY